MISMFAGLMLQGLAQAPAAPAPPPPPPERITPARAPATLASLISADDYPAEALRNDEEGAVGFRLHVGTDGSVTNCAVTSSSGSASLDSATCRIMTARARFTPARNNRGKAAPDTVSARIVWRIEGESALMPIAALLRVETTRATVAGEVTCSSAVNAQPADEHPCPSDVAHRFGETARAVGRSIEQTAVIIMTPDGEVEPVDAGDYGVQFLGSEFVLSVATDGSILACRLTRNEALGVVAAGVTPPDPCSAFKPSSEPAFQPAAEPGPPRAVRVKLRGYRR